MNQIHATFKENPLAWGYYFLGHHFTMASPPFHVKILQEILQNKKVVACAPRSHSKSTLAMVLFPIWGVCFQRFRHIIILQANLEKAIASLKTIKAEFEDNDLLRKTYKIKMPVDTQNLTVFRHPDGFETQVVCFGMEQMGKIRGSKFGAYRPDCILVDDLETDELVRTRELREDLHRKFKDAVEPAIDIAADYRIVYIDTMKHYDSQLAKMISSEMYTDFKKLFFPAIFKDKDGNEKALWEERFSLEHLKKLEKEDPVAFAKEYMGDPVTGQSATFDAADFRRWTVNTDDYLLYDKDGSIISRGSLRDCKVAIGYDLAWEEKRRHDYTAIVPCYITPNSEILVDFYINEKGVKPDVLAEHLFNMDAKYQGITKKVVVHGFEKGKYEKVFKWLLDQERKKRNKFPIVKDVPWVTDKKERITIPLQPRYANHAIFHRKDMGDLESQLMRFPSGTNDDILDSLSLAVRLLCDAPTTRTEKVKTQDDKFNDLKKMFMPDKKFKGYTGSKQRQVIPAEKSFLV
jgi:phage terminase large subunit-like protein